MSYDPSTTSILLVDPYNDFLSEGGKLWPRAKAVAEQVNLLDHLRAIVKVARDKGFKIYFVPHHRWERVKGNVGGGAGERRRGVGHAHPVQQEARHHRRKLVEASYGFARITRHPVVHRIGNKTDRQPVGSSRPLHSRFHGSIELLARRR